MKKIAFAFAFVVSLFASTAWADGTIDTLSAGTALGGTESIPMFQTANPAVKTTPSAISTYMSATTQTLTNKSISGATNTLTNIGNAALTNSSITIAGHAVALGGTQAISFSDLTGQATNAQLATQSANTVLGALTATTPSGLAMPSCSTSSSALIWTTGTGYGCNIISASATSFTPGTTTILGATAPCSLVNTTSTTSGCLAYGLTGNNTLVETTSGGLLTASILPIATNTTLGGFKPDNTTIVVNAGTGIGSLTASDTVHAGSFSGWNIGGQDDSSSSGTATLPTFTAGQSALLTAQSGSTVTVGLNSQTVNGLGLNTTLHQFGFYGYTYSSSGVLSAYGFPGYGTITTNAIGKFIDASGATTASSLTDNGTTISTAETLTLTGLSAGTQVSCMGLNSGNVVVLVASACGSGGGSGTVNSGTANHPSYYATNGTAVSTEPLVTDNQNTWQVAEAALSTPFGLTDGASIAVNAFLSNNFTVTLAGNRTLANPTNTTAGQWLDFVITQDGTGSRTLAFGAGYLNAAGGAFTVSLNSAAAAVTEIGCKVTATAPTLICYGPVNSATSQAQVSAPVAPANTTTYFMQGLAGTITPKTTGAVILTISGTVVDPSGTAAGNGIIYQLSYGTGSAPANAAALAGTQVGTTQSYTSPTTVIAADTNVPFSTTAAVTGLTVGTAYWIDLAAKSVATVSSMGLANVSVTAIEVR